MSVSVSPPVVLFSVIGTYPGGIVLCWLASVFVVHWFGVFEYTYVAFCTSVRGLYSPGQGLTEHLFDLCVFVSL